MKVSRKSISSFVVSLALVTAGAFAALGGHDPIRAEAAAGYPVGAHPYTLFLERKYSYVYRPSRPYVRGEFDQLLALSGWPRSQWSKMYRVATCESTRRWRTGGTFVGLMQHRVGNGAMNRRQLENPVLNLIVARWMYESRGWQPWPVCGRR